MKSCFYFLSILFVLCSCKQENDQSSLLKQADLLAETAPDSAYAILQSIEQPEEMNNPDFAYWCLISGKIFNHRTDDGKIFLPALYYERACKYYLKHGTPEEKSFIRLYLGRAYQETAEYNQATLIYTEALNEATQWQEYNAAGMICSYLGEIFSIQDYADKCKDKYHEAIDFFKLANNQRAIALMLSDIGFEYILDETPLEGLPYLFQADSIADLLQDTSIFIISLNIGSAYVELKEYSLAETYLLKALKRCKTKADSAIIYYTLSDIHIAGGDYEKAYEVLEQGTNSWTMDGVHYQRHLIEEGKGNFEQALKHLKAYQQAIDSTQTEQNKMRTLEIEQKYKFEHAENEKNKALIKAQRNSIFLLAALIVLLFTIILYQLMRRNKNKIIAQQQEDLNKADNAIYRITVQLEQEKENLKKNRLLWQNAKDDIQLVDQQDRVQFLGEKLFNTKLEKITHISAIGKRILKFSQKVIPGSKGLSGKEWNTLTNLFRKTFPALEDLLWNPDDTLSKSEVHMSLLTFFNFDTKQESIVMGINPSSVYRQRNRLRQSLKLEEGADIFNFFKTYCMDHE